MPPGEGLSALGVEEALALREALADEPIELGVASALARRRRRSSSRSAAATCRGSSCPGSTRSASGRSRAARSPPTGPGRGERARRALPGWRREPRARSAGRFAPGSTAARRARRGRSSRSPTRCRSATSLDAADGRFPAARIAPVPHATPLELDAESGRAAAETLRVLGGPRRGSPICRLTTRRRERPAAARPAHCRGVDVLERVEALVRPARADPAGGEVTCLVSGGADSTCLWHVLGALGYRVSAVHVHHGVRGAEADADAGTARGARRRGRPRRAARRPRRRCASSATRATARLGLRATGHTASDQVETVLYRLVSSGSTRGIKAAPRGRRRAPAARRHARGDRGVLPRARPAGAASTRRTPTRSAG